MKSKKLFRLLFLLLLAGLSLSAYDAIIFGDVHFDSLAVRDPAIKRHASLEKEKERNIKLWGNDIPALLTQASQMAGKDTAFAVQLGDIVQGDCGNGTLHEKSLNTVLPQFRESFSGIRFLAIPGNHDIRGNGAAASYDAVMIPYLSQTLGQALPSNGPIHYSLTQENDLFIFMDCNRPDLNYLKDTLAAHPNRRHLFVLTHFPVLFLSQSAPLWTLFDKQSAVRDELFDLLAANHAIVLCAHVHITTLVRWKNDSGSITQVSLFSMFNSTASEPAVIDKDLKNLFPKFQEPPDSPDKQKVRAVLGKYLPKYTEFKVFGPAANFAVLKPNDAGITLELYNPKDTKPVHTLKLK